MKIFHPHDIFNLQHIWLIISNGVLEISDENEKKIAWKKNAPGKKLKIPIFREIFPTGLLLVTGEHEGEALRIASP